MIKGSIQEEDVTFIHIYAPKLGALKCIKQTLTAMRREVDSNTIIVEDLKSPVNTNG